MNDLLRQYPEIGCYDILIDKNTVDQVVLCVDGHNIVVGNLSDDIYTSSDFAGYDVRNGDVVNTYTHRVSMYYDACDAKNEDICYLVCLLRDCDVNHPVDDISVKIYSEGKYYFYSGGINVEFGGLQDNLIGFSFKNFATGDIDE